MKRLFLFTLLACTSTFAQSFGPFSLTGSQCASVDINEKATAAYQFIGTWSGTVQPRVSVLGQPPINTQATPAASTTAQSTVTANGAYFSSISGYSSFLLCGNTITGTATVYINVSSAAH